MSRLKNRVTRSLGWVINSLLSRLGLMVCCCAWVAAGPSSAATQPAPARTTASKSTAPPNIILITMDTTRADRMGFLGSKRGLTPNLDALARDSAVFTRAYAQAPLTDTSHATILTGTYPLFHQVVPSPLPLSKDLPYLPDILKAHGYATAAFIGSLALDPSLVGGFDRGFDAYDAGYTWKGYTPKTRFQTVERRGGEVVARALAWLSQHQRGPFFLWVHLYDPHDPYDPPEPYKTRYAKALYDGEIAYMDSALAKLFRQLKADGLYDSTIVAATADHGEALGAHGENTHGVFLYDETIHVPLLIKLPGQAYPRARIEARVELADLMPTLLESVGIAVPSQVQGESLLKLMKKEPEGEAAALAWRDRGAYSRADYGTIAYGWSPLESLRSGKYLYIQAPRRELYDDGADPTAAHNLASTSPAVADMLSARLKAFEEKTANPQPTAMALLDEVRTRQLAALGYVANLGRSPNSSPAGQLPDPKDKIEIANLIIEANWILADYHCREAIPKIRKITLRAPNVAPLHYFLGRCYAQEKDPEKALPELRTAVKLDPNFTQAEMQLGVTLLNLQALEEATSVFEHVAQSQPKLFDAHLYLLVTYARLHRVPEEIKECRTVLQTSPDHFGANLNLGRFLAESGDLEGAIPSLQKAASLQPTAPLPHIFLADVYAKLGRDADAEQERAEAERLRPVHGSQLPFAPDADSGSVPKQ